MKIHRGTKFNGTIPCRWIEPRTKWQFELDDLIIGLCSKYWRDRTDDDDPLPEALPADRIIEIAKEQHEQWGTNAVWTWSDDLDDHTDYTREDANTWARRLILAVLPDLEVPKETTA